MNKKRVTKLSALFFLFMAVSLKSAQIQAHSGSISFYKMSVIQDHLQLKVSLAYSTLLSAFRHHQGLLPAQSVKPAELMVWLHQHIEQHINLEQMGKPLTLIHDQRQQDGHSVTLLYRVKLNPDSASEAIQVEINPFAYRANHQHVFVFTQGVKKKRSVLSASNAYKTQINLFTQVKEGVQLSDLSRKN